MRIFLIIPDGVGVRNFLLTDYIKNIPEGVTVTIWVEESLAFLIEEKHKQDSQVIILPRYSTTPLINVLLDAKQKAEILHNAKKFKDPIFKSYLKRREKGIKHLIKSVFELVIPYYYTRNKDYQQLKLSYLNQIRKTQYYHNCKNHLIVGKPDMVFCTHQRARSAIAPLLAAKDLEIPTACFIYSWDNLPKATLTVQADHYLVWSMYMKQEMASYYPEIPQSTVHVAGTPQFTPYFNNQLKKSRTEFCREHNLDERNHFICFSGDDKLTSPHDHLYLEDLADAVSKINIKNKTKYIILFRRCPTDWSNRYNRVLNKYNDIIKSIDPKWQGIKDNNSWSSYIPAEADIALLVNTVLHCDIVVNVGSTMALDFAILKKPSCYLNYDPLYGSNWSVNTIYKLIHFRIMDDLDPVYWINSKEEIIPSLTKALNDTENKLYSASIWLKRVSRHPLEHANTRIWNILKDIAKN